MNSLVLNGWQVRQVDERAQRELGLPGLVLMENAGRGCVEVLLNLGVSGPVVIACGKGNNGGDGFVMARHLANRGLAAKVLLWNEPNELSGDAAANFGWLAASRVPVVVLNGATSAVRLEAELAGAAWIVDALLGTGSQGEPRPPLDAVIERLNGHPAQKLAVDLPSGLNCETGQPARHTFIAQHTCTFVAPKPGFFVPRAQPYVGQLHVIDIGVPRALIEEIAAAEAGPAAPGVK